MNNIDKDLKTIKLSYERITDLLNFINNRIQLGVNGNLLGETKAITEIVIALEKALMDNNENVTNETIVNDLKKSKCEEV